MDIQQSTLKLIRKFEGTKLNVYDDVAGKPTIGTGHLLTSDENASGVYADGITQDQADNLLMQDLQIPAKVVNKYVDVNTNQGQFDALVSFVYNVGSGNFLKSTLLERINEGDSGASDEFMKWNKAGGQVVAGLTNRRVLEKATYDGLV